MKIGVARRSYMKKNGRYCSQTRYYIDCSTRCGSNWLTMAAASNAGLSRTGDACGDIYVLFPFSTPRCLISSAGLLYSDLESCSPDIPVVIVGGEMKGQTVGRARPT